MSELFTTVSAAAKRLTEKEMLGIKMAALCYIFNWHKSFQKNMEQFHLHINKLTSYSLTCNSNESVLRFWSMSTKPASTSTASRKWVNIRTSVQ
jgi:hypothetical protein